MNFNAFQSSFTLRNLTTVILKHLAIILDRQGSNTDVISSYDKIQYFLSI